jgi:glycerol-3-phosphate dehydrogenase
VPDSGIHETAADVFDLAIIGGGVNGCGIARDAAGRGLGVVLFEQGDLAQATSSASTKLLHGGLRYLENFEFRLVREALVEREVLLRSMPHISWPLRFVLPHHRGLRPAWLLRLGLFLYDHLGGRRLLPGARTLNLATDPAGAPLKESFVRGFEYPDCWVDDSRLVVLNARDAADRGADIRTRTRFERARRGADHWTVSAVGLGDGRTQTVRARALVNAAGPWVDEVLTQRIGLEREGRVRLVRGSHIVVARLFAHDRAYILQQGDGRVVFAIPYEGDFTLIGTTEADHAGDPLEAACSEDEARYLCDAVSHYFARPVTPADIVWSYAGVRPLHDDGASSATAASRDYVVHLDAPGGQAPLLNILGGKITTHRRLAEAALAKLAPFLPEHRGAWTGGASLPGGGMAVDGAARLVEDIRARYRFLDERSAWRLVRAYGTLAADVLGPATTAGDLGEPFGAGLTAREVDWLMRHEWARTAEDVLWRRSKLGLRLDAAQVSRLETWMGGMSQF